MHMRFINWFCGFSPASATDLDAADDAAETAAESRLDAISNLEQSPVQRAILYVNLVIVISLALGAYVYFTISPFSVAEIDALRTEKLAEMRGTP